MRCTVHGSAPASSVISSSTNVSTPRPVRVATFSLAKKTTALSLASITSVTSSPRAISSAPRMALNTHGSPGSEIWIEPPGKQRPSALAMSNTRVGVSVACR
jgi:hypothetical protein